MSSPVLTNSVDPVYYDSVPWLFYLVETDIYAVRRHLDDPQRSSMYCRDIHRKQLEIAGSGTFVDLSRFIQIKYSTWTVCCISGRLDMLFRCRKNNVSAMQRDAAEYLSGIFQTRALLFGYHNVSDTVYYEMFDQGFQSKIFHDSPQYEEKLFESADCSYVAPTARDIFFIEERFRCLNIFVPLPELYNDGENRQIVRGRLAQGSIFSEHDLQGFDCALLHCF